MLDRYTRQRRKAQTDFVQAQTIQNKKSLEEKDPVVRRKHLDELRRISEDVKLHKQFLYRSSLFDSLQVRQRRGVTRIGICRLSCRRNT